MHEVCLVLEQLVDTLDDVPLAEHDFVPHRHKLVLHVCPQPVHEVYALVEERLEEFFLDIPPVGKHFPVEVLGEHAPHPFVPVVHVRPCEAECYDLARIVAQQVQLETVAPSHRAFPILGEPGEHLVEIPADVVAHGDHGTVDEGDAGTFPEGVQPHEKHHQQENPRCQLDEAVVRDGIRETVPHAPPDAAQVVVLEGAVRAEMVAHEYGHYLAFGQPAGAVPVPYAVLTHGGETQVLRKFLTQILVKLIDNTENLYNFVFGNHRLLIL